MLVWSQNLGISRTRRLGQRWWRRRRECRGLLLLAGWASELDRRPTPASQRSFAKSKLLRHTACSFRVEFPFILELTNFKAGQTYAFETVCKLAKQVKSTLGTLVVAIWQSCIAGGAVLEPTPRRRCPQAAEYRQAQDEQYTKHDQDAN